MHDINNTAKKSRVAGPGYRARNLDKSYVQEHYN